MRNRPILRPILRPIIAPDLATLSAGVGVPYGYTATYYQSQRVYYADGAFNLSSGRRVFDNGVTFFMEAA